MIRKLKEKELNFPPHVVLEAKNVTIDWDKNYFNVRRKKDNVGKFRWFNPVFL